MRVRALLSFVAGLGLFTASPLFACSVCGCDPAAGTLELDRPSTSFLRLAVEDRILSKESGAGDARESERENRALLRLQYSLARLTLQAEVPGFLWKRHLDALGVQDDVGHGLGDVAFSARYELLREGGLAPRHVLAVIAGIKLPTGANDRHLPGALPDEHLQLGTGTFDETLGLAYEYGEHPWTLYANATARLNGTNNRRFQFGNALFGTLGARRNFLESERLIVSLEAQLRAAGKDRIDGGASFDENSGGKVFYGTASAAYAIADNLLVRGTVQVPVVTDLSGVQHEHTVGTLQLAYDFAL